MKRTAIIVAPGRGTYNREELGYLRRHHADKAALLAEFDAFRAGLGQDSLTGLDGAARYSGARHTRGDNASALIHACAYADFLSIDRARYEILGITGNSMGWYIALACAGVLGPADGLRVVNTMGTLMHERAAGGQVVYPVTDDDWRADPARREEILGIVEEIGGRADAALALSIDLGGMLVLAGDEAGLEAFGAAVPRLEGRFPMRLPNHAAFHTPMMEEVAAEGRARLGPELFCQPALPLVDGRGGMWFPKAAELSALRDYTLGHQVVAPYDFAAAIRTTAREFMPDVFIVLGPGTTLGGSVAQSLVRAGWRGISCKDDFKALQEATPVLLSMGLESQRALVTA